MIYEPNKCYPFNTFDLLNAPMRNIGNISDYTMTYNDLKLPCLILNFSNANYNSLFIDFPQDEMQLNEIYTGIILLMLEPNNPNIYNSYK